MTHHIAAGRHNRTGRALTNFSAALPAGSHLARELVADTNDLDFLALDPG